MVSSKVKGHRIGDGQVEEKHLHPSFRLNEDKMVLDHPTHSNEADLTLSQRNTLTQMGNADHLHFHTGGGGGPQGIYTNEERDVQLLKLGMLVNSTKYGLDKSVKEEFDDDSSIDYGMRSGSVPELTNITNGPELGTLQPNKRYSYGVTYKSKYGETNIANAETITTGAGANNSVELKLKNIPAGNEGAVIYRTEGDAERLLVENESLTEWQNPENMKITVEGSDKTSGHGSLKLNLKGRPISGSTFIGRRDLAAGIGKRVVTGSSPLSTAIPNSNAIAYVIGINNKGNTNRLDLVWDKSPANVPADYEIFYTTDTFVTEYTGLGWKRFESLVKPKTLRGEELNIATDGQVSSDGAITDNTRPTNVFLFSAVANITGIKVVINRTPQFCNLVNLRLWSERSSVHATVRKEFASPLNMSSYGTLKVDVKSNQNHQKAKMALMRSNEAVASVLSEWATNLPTAIDMTGRTIRTRVREATPTVRPEHDRFRISISLPVGEYVKIENFHLHLDNVSAGVGAVDSAYPAFNRPVPITFGGKNGYEGTPTTAVQTSDWIPITFPPDAFGSYVITFTVAFGRVMHLLSGTSVAFSWHVDSNLGRGLEGEDWLGSIATTDIVSLDNTAYLVSALQLGKSDASGFDLDYFDDEALDRWHRHYLPIPGGTNAESIQNILMRFDNLLVDQELYIDNIVMSKTKNVFGQVAGTTIEWSTGGQGASNIIANTATFGHSDVAPTVTQPKSLLIATPTVESLNKVLLFFGKQRTAGKSFALQYASDPLAKVNDAYANPLWLPVTDLRIGEQGIPSDFTGSIVSNVVYDNNVWNNHIALTFDEVNALKFRVIFFSSSNGERIEVTNIKLMTSENLGDFKKIYETPTFVTEGQVILDDGKAASDISPPEFNTTGSHNVYYDGNLHLMRLIDKSKPGAVVFRELTLEMYQHIILTAQTIGDVSFYVDNGDGGEDFDPVNADSLHTFGNQSTELILKAELLSPDAALSAMAFLYSL